MSHDDTYDPDSGEYDDANQLKYDPTTHNVEGKPPSLPFDVPAQQFSSKPRLRLFLTTRDEPLVFEGPISITLGRDDPLSDVYPTVDLTPEKGQQLGVSRFHAQIELIDNRYHVQDLGSNNGTWLNGSRLETHRWYPLSHGDKLMLGHLLMLVG